MDGMGTAVMREPLEIIDGTNLSYVPIKKSKEVKEARDAIARDFRAVRKKDKNIARLLYKRYLYAKKITISAVLS
jgi:hypothetical protein